MDCHDLPTRFGRLLGVPGGPALTPDAIEQGTWQAVCGGIVVERVGHAGTGGVDRAIETPGDAERGDPLADHFQGVAARVPEDDAGQVLPGVVGAVDTMGLRRQPGIEAGSTTRNRVPAHLGRGNTEELAHLARGKARGAD